MQSLVESLNVNTFLQANFIHQSGIVYAQRKPQFGIYNLQNGSYIQVGEINQAQYGQDISAQLNPDAKIVYPGGTLKSPSADKAAISISMNRGLENFGAPPSKPFEILYQGSDVAITHIEQRTDILPNHKFERFDYSSGAFVFHHGYALQQLSKVKAGDNFGIATIGSASSQCTIGICQILQEIDVQVPVLSGGSLALELSNPF